MEKPDREQRASGSADSSDDFFRRLVESVTSFAIIGFDAAGSIISWNAGAERFFGYRAEEAIGEDTEIIFTPEDRAKGMPQRELTLAREQGETADIRWHLKKDGTRIWSTGAVNPLRNDAGEVVGFVKVCRDATLKKQLEDERERLLHEANEAHREAEEANRSKDSFLAVVSHELRNALNSILGYARLIKDGKINPSGLRRAAEIIERNARGQAKLIEDLLDISRITAGRLRLEIESVNLGFVIQEALDDIRPLAEAKGVSLRFSNELSGPVAGDAARLLQVVTNLLTNAIKFTPQGGRIDITLRQTDGMNEITVSDTGKGIRPEFLPYVFDQFRQAEPVHRKTGLGLGLTIVRQLVELHGGIVEAFSEGEGKGSTFRVILPLQEPSVQPQPQPEQEAECPPALDGVKVLIVEDQPDARELLVTLLEECRAAVTAVATIGEALEAVRRDPPDVILSDIALADGDGYELLERVRRSVPEHDIPAVAVTVFSEPEEMERALAAGFRSHIAKPVDPDKLLGEVARLAPKK